MRGGHTLVVSEARASFVYSEIAVDASPDIDIGWKIFRKRT